MVVRLVVVFGGYSLNFVRNTGYVEISMEQLVVDVSGCIYYVSEEFRLESLDYFYGNELKNVKEIVNKM